MIFVQALAKFKIAQKVVIPTPNKKRAEALKLTMETDSADVRRTFQLMWEKAKLLHPKVDFDPLMLFENDGN